MNKPIHAWPHLKVNTKKSWMYCTVQYITFWFINVPPNYMVHISPAVELKQEPPKAPPWNPPVVIPDNITLNSFILSLMQYFRHIFHFICSFVQHVVQYSSVLIQTAWKNSGLLPSSLIWKQPLGSFFSMLL